MTKQELIQAAKEIREICSKCEIVCDGCYFLDEETDKCVVQGVPSTWCIERLERDSNGRE